MSHILGLGQVPAVVTMMGGNAVKAGSMAAKERLIEAAADFWQCDRSEVVLHNGVLINKTYRNRNENWRSSYILYRHDRG